MKLTPGNALTVRQKEMVKAAFLYRLTTENGYPKRNPCGATIAAISDSQWLIEHAFYIKKNGELADKPRYCEPIFMVELT